MAEHREATGVPEITSSDRLWAALAWLPVTPVWPVLAVLALLLEDTKGRPFVRYNAVLSIATGVILIPLTIVTLGLAALAYFVFFYWAYRAYQGQTVEIPVVSSWIRQQAWAQ
jgi:membrane-anchored glycerophosphoryl diester phosphodiesterase (GDPDase)